VLVARALSVGRASCKQCGQAAVVRLGWRLSSNVAVRDSCMYIRLVEVLLTITPYYSSIVSYF